MATMIQSPGFALIFALIFPMAAALLLFSPRLALALGSEGRPLYGHRAYGVAKEAELKEAGPYRGSGRTVMLRRASAEAFNRMLESALQDNVELVPISGFRTYLYQEGLFKRAVKKYNGPEGAARWVAPPGHSEHHTGRALDIGEGKSPGCDVEACFEETRAFKWLSENAGSYGFVLSFSKEERAVSFEPWHWRYAGKEKGEGGGKVSKGE